MNRVIHRNMNLSFYRKNLVFKAFSTNQNNFKSAFGVSQNSVVKRGNPESFIGDLQEILKVAPNNVNAYFFSWSISCRAATAFLCLLLL
jgi:hypothetical protein